MGLVDNGTQGLQKGYNRVDDYMNSINERQPAQQPSQQPSQLGVSQPTAVPFDQYQPSPVVSPSDALNRDIKFTGNPKFANKPNVVPNSDMRGVMNRAGQEGVTYQGNPAYQNLVNGYLDRMAPQRNEFVSNEGQPTQLGNTTAGNY